MPFLNPKHGTDSRNNYYQTSFIDESYHFANKIVQIIIIQSTLEMVSYFVYPGLIIVNLKNIVQKIYYKFDLNHSIVRRRQPFFFLH